MLIALVGITPDDLDILQQAGCRVAECKTYPSLAALQARVEEDMVSMVVMGWQLDSEEATRWQEWLHKLSLRNLPVILVARREDQLQRTRLQTALDAGASDYLLSPLRPAEITTRLRLQLERAYPQQIENESISLHGYTFLPDIARVACEGRTILLTHKEFALALLLFRHLDRPLSRATIQEAVWGQDKSTSSRTIDTHVSRVRTKLGLRPERGFRLAPVYSYGYLLERVSEPPSTA